eukprot:5782433-Alexandrium_andersonii.AAC.1
MSTEVRRASPPPCLTLSSRVALAIHASEAPTEGPLRAAPAHTMTLATHAGGVSATFPRACTRSAGA